VTETFAHTKSALKQAFAARGIRPNKRLSQNFLIDPNLLRFVVKTAELTPNDVVLEIGSGPGNLTSLLADAAGAVCAVELDRKLYQFASEHLAQRLNVRLIHADILKSRTQIEPQVLETVSSLLAERPSAAVKVNVANILECSLQAARSSSFRQAKACTPAEKSVTSAVKVVSNLPYSVSTPVIMALLGLSLPIRMFVLTVQKEIAERLTATPATPQYSLLGVVVQAQAEVEVVRILPPEVFWPAPEVESAVVKILPSGLFRGQPERYRMFTAVARALFQARRKTAANALEKLVIQVSRQALLRQAGIEPTARGETLSPSQILQLSDAIRRE